MDQSERPRRKSSLVIVRSHRTFLSFAETTCSADSPVSRGKLSPQTLRRSSSDPVFVPGHEDSTYDDPVVISIPENRSFSCDFSQQRTSPPPPPVPRRAPNHKLFVGGLSCSTDEATLYQFMCRFGSVKNVTVKRNPLTGQSRRYAFVKFYHPPDSIVFEHPWILDDHTIRITKYQVSPEWKNHYYSDDERL